MRGPRRPFWKQMKFLLRQYDSRTLYKGGFDEYTNLDKFHGTYKKPRYLHPYGLEYLGVDPLKHISLYENEGIYKSLSREIDKKQEQQYKEREQYDTINYRQEEIEQFYKDYPTPPVVRVSDTRKKKGGALLRVGLASLLWLLN